MIKWVYDLEVLCNFFSAVFIHLETDETHTFWFTDKDNHQDIKRLYDFLIQDIIMIGYNNLEYDGQIIELFLKIHRIQPEKIVGELYKRSSHLINTNDKKKKNLIYESKLTKPQIDLFKIKHFDNKAKRTSLKWLEFAMHMKDIGELPINPNMGVQSKDDIKILLKYNHHDVVATKEFFYKGVLKSIQFRKEVYDQYGINVFNANDVKIGVEIFGHEIANTLGVSYWDLRKMGTPREYIDLGKCVLDYIEFNTPAFQVIKAFFKSQVIKETNGVFTNIDVEKIVTIKDYVSPSTIKYKKKLGKTVLEKLNVINNGFQYDFGAGGLHGCIKPGVYKSNSKYIILDIDVQSYYPNISIKNKFYPEHLGESFCDVYESMYQRRSKTPKSNPVNGMLKLALNGSYGKSNEEWSFLYDPKFTMSITINGQLLLCKLSEMLFDLEDFTLLQVNTDGLTIRVNRNELNKALQICKEWEKYTNLTLEYAYYNQMIIRDVNNYIAEYENGVCKLKGVFEIDPDWHKNHSKRIIPIAVYRFFVHNIPIEETILNHLGAKEYESYNGKDSIKTYGIYDFCIGVKASNGYHYEMIDIKSGEEVRTKLSGKVFRYFVSKNEGEYVVKTNGIRTETVEAHPMRGKYYKIMPFNEYFETDDINYQYYIKECNKLLNAIYNELTLFT